MEITTNIHETNGRSVTVALPEIDLTYENDRRALHHARNRIDADSPDADIILYVPNRPVLP